MKSCQSSGWATTKTLSAGVGGISRGRPAQPEINNSAARATYFMPVFPNVSADPGRLAEDGFEPPWPGCLNRAQKALEKLEGANEGQTVGIRSQGRSVSIAAICKVPFGL